MEVEKMETINLRNIRISGLDFGISLTHWSMMGLHMQVEKGLE